MRRFLTVLTAIAATAFVAFAVSGAHAANVKPLVICPTTGITCQLQSADKLYDGTNPFGLMVGSFTSGHVLEAGTGANQIIDGGAVPYTGCSGVTAGSYTSANITVTAAGCITAAANGSGGGGACTLLASYTVSGSSTSSFPFSSISGAYTNLRLHLYGAVSDAASGFVGLQFNGDTAGADYLSTRQYAPGNGAGGSGGLSGIASLVVAQFSINSATQQSQSTVMIDGYSGSTFGKSAASFAMLYNGSGITNIFTITFAGEWTGTAAITSITVVDASGGHFIAGTKASLEGCD